MRDFEVGLTLAPNTPSDLKKALEKNLILIEDDKENIISKVEEKITGSFFGWLAITLAGAFIGKLFTDLLSRTEAYQKMVDFIYNTLKKVKATLDQKIQNYENYELVFRVKDRKGTKFSIADNREVIALKVNQIFAVMRP